MSDVKGELVASLVDKAVSLAVDSVLPKIAGAATSLCLLLIEPVRDHWPLFLAVALLFFAMGFLDGVARSRSKAKKEAEAADAAEKDAESRKWLAESERMSGVVRLSHPWAKAMLVMAIREGAYCRDDEDAAISMHGLFKGCGFIMPNRISSGRIRLEPTEKLKRFVEENPRLFEDLEDEIEKHALYDPSRKRRSGWRSSGSKLDWWWYSDEEPTAPDLLAERSAFANRRVQE